jgi:hypothetical protein
MPHKLHGDLLGHLFPGVMFLVWAAFWAKDMLRRGGGNSAFMFDARPLPVSAPPLPAPGATERWLKLLLPLLAMLGEARWMKFPISDGSVSNYQHATAYVLVSLCGACDILVHRGRLPRGADRLMLAFTFIVIAFTLGFHGHNMAVATAVHADLAAALFVLGALILVEYMRPAPVVRWLEIYALGVSAAWFVTVGWILYVAQYDLMSEDTAVKTHLFFSWHLVGIAVLLLVVAALTTNTRATATRDT